MIYFFLGPKPPYDLLMDARMIVDEKVVTHIAELAQLKIDDEQIKNYVSSMQNILDLVEQMQSVNTDGIEPMSNPLDGVQRLRADKVTETDRRELYLQNAPETSEGLFLVPKVID